MRPRRERPRPSVRPKDERYRSEHPSDNERSLYHAAAELKQAQKPGYTLSDIAGAQPDDRSATIAITGSWWPASPLPVQRDRGRPRQSAAREPSAERK